MSQNLRSNLLANFLTKIRKEPVIMGILNLTPDSFSDGGIYTSIEPALEHARNMVAEGCAILDVGGESTRPGAIPISEEEELARILPVLSAISDKIDIPISIDTYKSKIAKKATECGAVVINDIWGLQGDPDMAEIVSETKSAIVITHNRKEIDPSISILDDLHSFFDHSLALAQSAHIPSEHIILDPGIGFGKTMEQNMSCIWNIDRLQHYGFPILLGLSRKSFIGHILQNKTEERLIGTLSANVISLMKGAAILRVHDIKEHQEAIAVFSAIKGRDNV